jgi:hypothetical protein
VDLADGDRVEEVLLLAPYLAGGDEVGLFEHPEVLHHAEARQLGQHGAELGERLAVAAEQGVEQRPPVGVGQGPEGEVHEDGR